MEELINKVKKYCEENNTSERELMKLFNFPSRYFVKKFLKENDIQYNRITEEERRNKIILSKSYTREDLPEILTFIENNTTSERDLVNKFNFTSRQSLRTFLKKNNITYKRKDKEEINKEIKESWDNKSYLELKDIENKRKETMTERYGVEYALQSPDLKKKMFDNNYNKYGVKNVFQIDDVVSKRKETMIDRYGVEFSMQSEEIITKTLSNMDNNRWSSKPEREITDWLTSLGLFVDKKYIKEYKNGKYIRSFEIDMFIPEKNIGIEFNGSYWHSSDKKDKNYHYNKSRLCRELGIRLIHIFEPYWNNPIKREIYKSIIMNATGFPIKKIRASKCEIRKIDSKEAKEFFEENHMGGYVSSKLAYGLFFNNTLVQAELFGKSRFNKNIEWESIRGCSKMGFMIYGGYEKVLKKFKEDYNPISIISYVDFNLFSGALHEHAGFKFKNFTGPDHWYEDFDGNLKRYWIVRGSDEKDIEWANKRDNSIKRHYWFSGSIVYVWGKEN